VRVAEATGAADLFWYVKGDSPIKSLKDTESKVPISPCATGG
jgi:hypothetical protein